MGNRANGIVDRLEKMGIVSAKFANQPRKVLPKTFESIPQDVIHFLTSNGVPPEKIEDIFTNGSIGPDGD